MLELWGRVLIKEPHGSLCGCRKFSYKVWLIKEKKKNAARDCFRPLKAGLTSKLAGCSGPCLPKFWKSLAISSALPLSTVKTVSRQKMPLLQLVAIASHPSIASLHEKSVSTTHQAVENSKQLPFSLHFSRLSNASSLILSSHTVCVPAARYFSSPLLESRQFTSIFLIELYLFCLSKARVREDLKTWGLCKPEGKENQGSTTESWSQIKWITVRLLSY